MKLDYTCPKCDKELEGNFNEDVCCLDCKVCYETDWDYDYNDNLHCWINKETERPLNNYLNGTMGN